LKNKNQIRKINKLKGYKNLKGQTREWRRRWEREREIYLVPNQRKLLGVSKKTGKPIKPRKPEKKITEKTEPKKKPIKPIKFLKKPAGSVL